MPKVCPLCHKTYDSEIAMHCLHGHCPNCGDTDFNRLHPQDRNYVLAIVFTLVSSGLVGPVIASVGYITLEGGFIVFVTFGLAVGLGAFTYYGRYDCNNCGAKFYFPRTGVDLVEEYIEKRCRSCGSTLPKNAKFCGKCGEEVS